MYCVNCKAKMNDGDSICKNCGARNIITINEEQAYLSQCPVCGQKISNTAEICPHCGQKTLTGNKKEEEKVYLILSVISTIFAIIGGIMVVSSMPVTRNTEGTFLFGVIMLCACIGVDIGIFIKKQRN